MCFGSTCGTKDARAKAQTDPRPDVSFKVLLAIVDPIYANVYVPCFFPLNPTPAPFCAL